MIKVERMEKRKYGVCKNCKNGMYEKTLTMDCVKYIKIECMKEAKNLWQEK